MNRSVFYVFVFGVFFTTVVYLCDVSYLFHGIRCTYFRGESSAQIDDNIFFHTRTVPAKKPFEN